MMMPFLQIDSSIVSHPSRLHLSIIESWMLWPHDEPRRLDAYKAAVVETGRDLRQRQVRMDPTLLEELFDLAAGAKPLDQITQQITTPYEHGIVAGTILIVAMQGKDSKGDRLSRGEIDQRLRKSFARQRGDNSKFVNTIWQNYRSVSHLWAAHIKYTESEPDPLVFPCEVRDVIKFLWLSEEWRKKGESTRSSRTSPSTVLRAGECVRVPEGMKFSS